MTGLPSELHASIYERATNPDALDFQRPDLLRFGREGDRIYPLIPELSDVIGSPSVSGALTSLLGRGWRLGCHRTLHGGGGAQGIHKDTQRDKAVLPHCCPQCASVSYSTTPPVRPRRWAPPLCFLGYAHVP